ncbi:phenylacetate--CoA ligase family protein [Salinactinospora qingdaonensis]|uniref:AMP-binding protein n=1 Tax=Salinactinospora qingdaonensis TaxID=702744 RepID=A0ABP7F5E5_9ACTN
MTARPWDSCETWPRDKIREHQRVAMRDQLERVYARSAYYRRVWDALGFSPGDVGDLDDLAALPITTKRDYQTALTHDPPWGSALALAPEQVRRVHFSSGTTAAPTPVCWSAYDLDRWADLYARGAHSQGVHDGDVYQCLFSYAWFVGGLGVTSAYTRLGATVIPGGSADTQRQIDTLFHYGTTAVGGTPSFLLHLAETAAEAGRPLHESRVRTVMTGGEPGGQLAGTRARLEHEWGARVYDGYGSLEFQPIAWECAEQAGAHLAEDFLYAEVLDPDTHRPVPDGTAGVLVLTHLDKRACPLVRWWTGDIVVRDSRPCPCSRTHARLVGGVRGRTDDMLVVRGVNLFPSAVEDIVRRTPGATGEFRIVVDPDVTDPETGYLTGIKLRVEALPETHRRLRGELAAAIRAELTVRALVEPLHPGELPRTTHKARRVVRTP